MRFLSIAVLASFPFLVSACSGGSVPIKQVYHAERCGQDERGLYVAQSKPELLKIITPRLKPTRIDLSSDKPSGAAPVLDIEVDFDTARALVVALGQMPSPGYGVSLTSSEARLQNGVVNLPVSFSRPDPEAFYAQVITSPCLVVSLPRGDYEKAVAGDLTAYLPEG